MTLEHEMHGHRIYDPRTDRDEGYEAVGSFTCDADITEEDVADYLGVCEPDGSEDYRKGIHDAIDGLDGAGLIDHIIESGNFREFMHEKHEDEARERCR